MVAEQIWSLDNPVFKAFISYGVVVVVKTMAMSVLTTRQRFAHKAFVNPEDTASMKDKEGGRLKVTAHDAVERVRRCHLNDLENVIPFFLIGLLYVSTSPDLSTALLHFRVFTGARLFHSVAYLLPLPQPSRALGFFAGYVTTLSMAYRAIAATGFFF
ncbi:microsomal glutathione S-transferase 1-like isoform X3 [Pomacea canaliculata]|uniref:microsomal glutathione S-transferase 1-like isoform X3 n=1 Tax=Pomacea canaliculata TaxID=400727 RepID=UPI000D7345BF|nr:microsomal glutathione S-transferase 1-like isoform X3 [Pomacea canaliculata]